MFIFFLRPTRSPLDMFEIFKDTRVEHIIVEQDLYCAKATDTIEIVLKNLYHWRISSAPVLDDEERPLGSVDTVTLGSLAHDS